MHKKHELVIVSSDRGIISGDVFISGQYTTVIKRKRQPKSYVSGEYKITLLLDNSFKGKAALDLQWPRMQSMPNKA